MSDKDRWSNVDNYHNEWKTRTRLMATFIEQDSRIIEFGAGVNPISEYLDPSIESNITDFVEKGEIIHNYYDLNAQELVDFGKYDYAVLSGVVEYINNLPAKIKFIAERCDNILVSYSTIDKYPDNRENRGWVNSYSDLEFIKIFTDLDMRVLHQTQWKNQEIYNFRKNGI